MKMTEFLKFELLFPSKIDWTPVHEFYLKRILSCCFYDIYGIHLEDGHDGKYDGLVQFSVNYNSLYKVYTFKLCGGNNVEQKVEQLRQFLISEGYKINGISHTWCYTEDEDSEDPNKMIEHRGPKLEVGSKNI